MKSPSARSTAMRPMTLTRHLHCLLLIEPAPVARHQLHRPTISVLSSGCWDSAIEHVTLLKSTQLYLERYSTSKRLEDQDYPTQFTQLNLDQLNLDILNSTQLYLERHSTSINSTLLGAAQHKQAIGGAGLLHTHTHKHAQWSLPHSPP